MYALVTGASSGIGKEIAILLAKKGYNLILVARRKKRLEDLQEYIDRKYSVQVLIKECDLSIRDNCFSLFEECKKYHIQVLINNAGFGKVGQFQKIPCEDEIAMIQTNIMALLILTKLYVNHMRKGYILNVASIAGFQPVPMMATYGATKAFVLNFSQSVNYELKRHHKKVSISTLCPGPVNTEFNQVAGAEFNLQSITAKKCALEAIQGLFSKKDVIIPSISIKVLHGLSKIAPNKIILPVEYKIQVAKRDNPNSPD